MYFKGPASPWNVVDIEVRCVLVLILAAALIPVVIT